jgi:hypothetical protein
MLICLANLRKGTKDWIIVNFPLSIRKDAMNRAPTPDECVIASPVAVVPSGTKDWQKTRAPTKCVLQVRNMETMLRT